MLRLRRLIENAKEAEGVKDRALYFAIVASIVLGTAIVIASLVFIAVE